MPEPPKKGESERVFISRCIRYLRNEGKTQEQAAGQCYGIWRRSRHSRRDYLDGWVAWHCGYWRDIGIFIFLLLVLPFLGDFDMGEKGKQRHRLFVEYIRRRDELENLQNVFEQEHLDKLVKIGLLKRHSEETKKVLVWL